MFDGARKLFRDSDTGWHIRTGERILATHQLPQVDPYSFSVPGKDWYAWEWGADVLMGAVHRWDGLRGVALLYMIAIAACTWLWYRLHWTAGGDFLIACAASIPMLSTANLHWLARPHVFGWLLLLAGLLLAETLPRRRMPMNLMVAALLGAIWANIHASFLFLPLLLCIYGVGAWIGPLIWEASPVRPYASKIACFGCAAAAMAASFLNPYGWKLHSHVLRYLGDTELLARVGEFQSFNFHAEGSFQILLTVGIAVAGGVLALANRRVDHFLLAVLLVGGALRSARGLPLVALALLPIANGAIAASLERATGLRSGLRAYLDQALAYSARLRLLDSGLKGFLLAPVLVLVCAAILRLPAVTGRIGFPPDEFPVAASQAVSLLPEDARLLAPDKFGGYLIYRFEGRRKVYFDGRSDYYGSAFMKDYVRLLELRPGWRDDLERFGFTHALLPNRYSLVPALEEKGWKPRYRDELCTLLSRN